MANKVITDFTEKTAPVAGDMLLMADSEAANAYKKLAIGNLLDGLSLCNEIMNFPANVGIDVDLDAKAQWWDKVGTPTTAVTMVDVAGEAGITETWEYALKTVADAASEGFYQRYTYADQPRIKSGLVLSAIAAVWVGTAGRTVTMSLTTSASTTVTATATAQAWTIVQCENLTLDGTYVDLKFTVDGADTFYVVPLGTNIGDRALRLPPRGLVFRGLDESVVGVDLTGKADEATWTDIDFTAGTSPLAAVLNVRAYLGEDAETFQLFIRTNGSAGAGIWTAFVLPDAERGLSSWSLPCDDSQIIEYYLDRVTGGGTLAGGNVYCCSFWEWA